MEDVNNEINLKSYDFKHSSNIIGNFNVIN